MKSVLGWLVVLALVIGAAGAGFYHFNNTTREQAYKLELSSLKRDFITNTTGLFLVDAERYRKEIGPHLSRYYRSVQKLAKDFPEFYDIERERKRGQEEVARGRMTEANQTARDERIDLTLDLYERMRDGQYRPIYTVANNNFRFDIIDITPKKDGGNSTVQFAYVHWAAFPEAHKPGSSPVSYKSIIGNIKAVQEKGKPAELPQIVGDAQPPSLQVSPERWVSEFIPGVEVGLYELPFFPQKAESVELSFMFGQRTIGGSEITSNIVFPEIPIPDGWKLGEGQAWEAQERFASDEELREAGVEPTQN